MRSRDEIIGALVEQVNWWHKIGKIGLIDMDDVLDAADSILTEEEYDFASETEAFRDALWSL